MNQNKTMRISRNAQEYANRAVLQAEKYFEEHGITLTDAMRKTAFENAIEEYRFISENC